jgi:hypothetical protein
MSSIFTYTIQISKDNYESEQLFNDKIDFVIREYFDNYYLKHFKLKELFIKYDLLDIPVGDIVNFWDDNIVLNFDIVDYETPDKLIEFVKKSIEIVNLNEEILNQNIVIKLNTYLLSDVRITF